MLRDLKRGEIEQLCVVVQAPALNKNEGPEGIEPKSALKERFAAQSLKEFEASKDVCSCARARVL